MSKVGRIGQYSLIISCFFASFMAFSGDPAVGKKISITCVACHGSAGISTNPLWPNLAGQKAQYIIKQLKAFKSGERKDPNMLPMAASLSEEDMKNLAAYYSGLKHN